MRDRIWRLAFDTLVSTNVGLPPYCDACDSVPDLCRCPEKKADAMEPGPELRKLLELFAQEVYQKGVDELQYDELKALRDMLVEKQDNIPVHEIS
jgi:hypothetical protein